MFLMPILQETLVIAQCFGLALSFLVRYWDKVEEPGFQSGL